MGMGYEWECPKCGYKFTGWLGVGFMYPKVYAETLEKAKNGELGEKLKKLLLEHPDAAIDPQNSIFQCSNCGEYDTRSDLTSYVPKKDAQRPPRPQGVKWSVGFPFEGASYVMDYEMKKYYDLYAEYDHRCEKCGGKMTKVQISESDEEEEIEKIEMICPNCKTPLKQDGMIYWD